MYVASLGHPEQASSCTGSGLLNDSSVRAQGHMSNGKSVLFF